MTPHTLRSLFATTATSALLMLAACSSGGGETIQPAPPDGGPLLRTEPTCSGSAVSCADGKLTACEDGKERTIRCQEQCVADGFEAGAQCSKDGSRCACGKPTDSACANGVDATCACLDGASACQGFAMLDLYAQCHRAPSSETATLVGCFARYKSGDQVACNTAIGACGGAVPSQKCTADADCGHCERCERSTGKCLTRVACD